MLTIEFLDPLAGHFSIDRFVHKTHLIQAKIKLTCSEHSSIFIFRPFFYKKSQQRSLKWFWLQCYTELFWPPLFWTWNFEFFWNWSTILSCYVFNWRVFICVTHKINMTAKFDKAWKDHICYTTKCLGQMSCIRNMPSTIQTSTFSGAAEVIFFSSLPKSFDLSVVILGPSIRASVRGTGVRG